MIHLERESVPHAKIHGCFATLDRMTPEILMLSAKC
jgi:hypothetical protein